MVRTRQPNTFSSGNIAKLQAKYFNSSQSKRHTHERHTAFDSVSLDHNSRLIPHYPPPPPPHTHPWSSTKTTAPGVLSLTDARCFCFVLAFGAFPFLFPDHGCCFLPGVAPLPAVAGVPVSCLSSSSATSTFSWTSSTASGSSYVAQPKCICMEYNIVLFRS